MELVRTFAIVLRDNPSISRKTPRTCILTNHEKTVAQETKLCYNKMQEIKEKYEKDFVYFDVMKAPLNKIKNKFRYQIMMRFKLENADEIEKEIFDCVPNDTKSSVFFEVNPNNLS